ncbi:TPA: SHOCT domain-containing protein [Proteus mirabilis]|nr:SHOCT domain-containing protein [Proteus mirabilis]
MSNRYDVIIDGDNSGLRRATSEAGRLLDNLSDQALNLDFGGGLRGMSDQLMNLSSGLGGFKGRLALAGGALAGLAGGLFIATSQVSEFVKEYSEISMATGINIEYLQQLEKHFKETGLAVDKFGDINKDTLDHLADAWRNGGGIEDDLESVGLKLRDYANFINDPNGGVKAAIQVFYDMKKAGRSMGEITFMMESLASDSSHLVGVLNRYNDAQEANNAILQENIKFTEETAKKYTEFEKNVDALTSNLKGLAINALDPVVTEINNMFNWFSKDWKETALYQFLDGFIEKLEKASKKMNNMGMGGSAGVLQLSNEMARQTEEGMKKLEEEGIIKKPEKVEPPKQNIVDLGESASEKKAREDAQKEAEKEAERLKREEERKRREAERKAEQLKREAERLAEEAKRKREQALSDLQALSIAMYSENSAIVASNSMQLSENLKKLANALEQGVITQEQYEEKRKSLIVANSENYKNMILGATPEDALAMLGSAKQIYEDSVNNLQNMYEKKLISHEEYLRRKADLEDGYNSRLNATNGLGNDKFNEWMFSIADKSNMNIWEEYQYENDDADRQLNDNIDKINKSDLPEIQKFKLIEQEHINHQRRLEANEKRFSNSRMAITNNMFDGMLGALEGFGLKNSGVYKAMFAVQKGYEISTGLMRANAIRVKAMAEYPFPYNYIASAGAYAQVLQSVMSIRSQSLEGMAHDGIDNIPREGTWLLNKGERVVDDRTNGDLKDFLKNQKTSEPQQQPLTVHAPLTIQGNVSSSDKMVMDAIKRHGQMVAQAVQDAQRRKM